MDISVIVCTYSRCESLRSVLEGLARLRRPQGTTCEIIVVDNNSKDATRSVVQEAECRYPGLFRYIFEARQGKSYALNTAVEAAEGRILAFTDDDIELHAEWLAALQGAFQREDCMGVGGRILPVWQSEIPWWYEESGPYRLMDAIVKLDLGESPIALNTPAWGANMAFRREAFDKYGKFRIDLGPTADSLLRGEDSEFWWRLIHGGEKLVYEPAALVYHPVELKRTTQEYFEKWYFDYGRTTVRREGLPDEVARIFGVPRFLIRQLGIDYVKWMMCPDPKRRFYFKLKARLTEGRIEESRIWLRSAVKQEQ